jgi:membrane protease YdiL (CAAX protease family)
MKRNVILILVALLCFNYAYSQSQNDTVNIDTLLIHKPHYSISAIILPGGTHFQDGYIGKGLIYSISEVGLVSTGIYLGNNDAENSYYNIPIMLASQIYVIDKMESYRNYFKYYNYKHPDFRYDNSSYKDLLLAPVKIKNIISPLVMSFIAWGVLDACISYPMHNERVSDIESVEYYGYEMNPAWGSVFYSSSALLMSYGAGVNEELLFRGTMMPMLDYKYGQTKGLIFTSLIFSALHIPSYINISDPYRLTYSVLQVTSVGLILGRYVQTHNYSVSKAIAAHAWFDFAHMMTAWLINPAENPLGLSVSFKL